MRTRLPEPSSPIAPHIVAFVRHKRALNRCYNVEDKALRMLDGVSERSRCPEYDRHHPGAPRCFFLEPSAHATVKLQPPCRCRRRLFEWMAENDFIDCSPVTMKPRRRS